MIEKTLAKRYATALLAAVNKEGSVEETETTLLALRDAYRGQPKFRSLLSSPKVPRAAKKALLRKLLAGATPSVREFSDLLVDKNRVALIPEIADMFDRLADAFKGVVRVQVRSAFPLSDPQKNRLKADLDRLTGKSCDIEAVVERSLKGGLQVRMGDSVVDGTVAHRLKGLREKLQELQKR